MRAFLIPVLTAVAATPALAQTADLATPAPTAQWTSDARLAQPVDASLLPVGLATAPAAPVLAQRSGSRRAVVTRTVVPGVIGAVLGSWVGYVASQVSRSDWDKESNGEFTSYRMGFAAGGAVVGAITGVVIGNNMGSGGGPGRTPRLVNASSRDLISSEEIEQSRARNALELIQTLRPRWLQVRGTNTFGETAQGSADDSGVNVTPGESPIKVYLDNALLGDVTVLRNLSMGTFSQVRFHDPAQATYRWGSGHLGGAIEFLSTPTTTN